MLRSPGRDPKDHYRLDLHAPAPASTARCGGTQAPPHHLASLPRGIDQIGTPGAQHNRGVTQIDTPRGTRTSPHPTSDGVSQADTHHNTPTAHLSAFHTHTVAPHQPSPERPPTGLTQPHSHSDDDLRQAHLTHRAIGQAKRPHEHTPTTTKLGQPTTTTTHTHAHTHTRHTSNSHELGPTNTATKRTTHQHALHLERAHTRRRSARGGDYPAPGPSPTAERDRL